MAGGARKETFRRPCSSFASASSTPRSLPYRSHPSVSFSFGTATATLVSIARKIIAKWGCQQHDPPRRVSCQTLPRNVNYFSRATRVRTFSLVSSLRPIFPAPETNLTASALKLQDEQREINLNRRRGGDLSRLVRRAEDGHREGRESPD